MANATLHYLYDPYCGWCFGAAPMLTAAQAIEGLHVEPHGIGMLAGPGRKMMSPEWRDFVRPHELRITALSHAEFGAPYINGILEDSSVVLDSSIPTAAMLAAEQLSGRGLEMLKRLQRAYYIEGKPIADRDVILQTADELGFDHQTFAKTFEDVVATSLDSHIKKSSHFLAALGAHGVPAFALQVGDKVEPFPIGRFYGKPERFAEEIRARLAAVQEPKEASSNL
ncbi:DsbA family protein [Paraburkholderia sp. J7]|uniref:DsbA family protein n=1 Tax=Paraburkholderia sp. J7 TaxID=2805438 RepID=UPI002AB74A02|nr:DsbA family protein [Paraburkholderia sp. J7]